MCTLSFLSDEKKRLQQLYNDKPLGAGQELVEAVLKSDVKDKWKIFLQSLAKGIFTTFPRAHGHATHALHGPSILNNTNKLLLKEKYEFMDVTNMS